MANIDKERGRLLALFNDEHEKVQIVLNFRHKLTPLGFEVYVSKFFRPILHSRHFKMVDFLTTE